MAADVTFVKTTVSSKGQIVLPAEFRQMDRVEHGQAFNVSIRERPSDREAAGRGR